MQSCKEVPHACPKCKCPVILGGGNKTEKFFDLAVLGVRSKSLFFNQKSYKSFSTSL
jgi:hypothetical protein